MGRVTSASFLQNTVTAWMGTSEVENDTTLALSGAGTRGGGGGDAASTTAAMYSRRKGNDFQRR